MKNRPTKNEKKAKNKTKAGVFKFTARKVPANTPTTISRPNVFTILKSTASYSECVFVDIIDVGIIIAKDVDFHNIHNFDGYNPFLYCSVIQSRSSANNWFFILFFYFRYLVFYHTKIFP